MRDPIRTIPKSKPTLNYRSGVQPYFLDRCRENTLELLIGAVRQRHRSGCSQNILDNLVGSPVERSVKSTARGAVPVVSEALKAQGVDVTPNQVSNIKYQMGLKKKGRRKAAAPEAAAAEAPVAKDAISLSALVDAKKLVAKLGSVETAKRAILALAQLGD